MRNNTVASSYISTNIGRANNISDEKLSNYYETISIADHSRTSLAFSIALHSMLLYFIIFGKPRAYKPFPEEKIITFEILDAADINNISQQTKKTNEIPIEEAKKILESRQAIESELENKPVSAEKIKKQLPKPLAETPKPISPPKTNSEILKMEKELKELIAEKKEPIKSEIKKQPESIKEPEHTKQPEPIKEPDTKAEDKKLTSKTESISELESLLKNLDTPSKGTNDKSNKIAEPKGDNKVTTKGFSSDVKTLSLTEITLIKKQIERSWNLPAGASGTDNILIKLYIHFNKNGEVLEVKLLKSSCPGNSKRVCQIIADSAIRAVKKASPIDKLRKDRYNIWGKINIEFDPSDILR